MDIHEMVDRAMFLGINEDFIDVDKYFWISNGEITFNLDTYIAKNTDERDICIVDGVDTVFMNLHKECYQDGASYIFTFPSTCSAVYSERDIYTKNSIALGTIYAISSNIVDNRFRNTVFDFRKCDKIQSVSRSFIGMNAYKVLFPKTLTRIYGNAFLNSKIRKLYAPGVKLVVGDAFSNSNIYDLNIGVQTRFAKNTFTFNSLGHVQKELIFKDVVYAAKGAFKNVKNVYMEYDVKRGVKEVRGKLVDMIKRIDAGEVILTELLDEFNEIIADTKRNDYNGTELIVKIENAIYYYLGWNEKLLEEEGVSQKYFVNEILKFSKQMYSISEIGLEHQNLYYFKKGSNQKVHDRNYIKLVEDEDLTIYLEK